MTVGVYGLVAGIVKLDDAGLYLSRRDGARVPARRSARASCARAPWLMKCLSDRRHRGDVPGRRRHPRPRHPAAAPLVEAAAEVVPAFDEVAAFVANLVVGIVTGGFLVGAVAAGRAAWQRLASHA